MSIRWSHLPTLALMIGYPIFWLELPRHSAHTSYAAVGLLMLWVLWKIYREKNPFSAFRVERNDLPILLLIGFILGIAFLAATLPIHLMQEADALNYHYSVPRQHLIIGSFAHLPWSTADLFFLPLQWAMSPYWFCTALPNKFLQFIFLIGLLAIAVSLTRYKTRSRIASVLVLAAIVGSHGLAIQFGSGMLDLVIAYLALASLDSYFREDYWLSGVELALFTWSKNFMLIQMGILVFCFVVAGMLLKVWQGTWQSWVPSKDSQGWRKTAISFLLTSVVVAGPFIAKSIYYAGTPMFPFMTFALGGKLALDPNVHRAMLRSVENLIQVRNAYGEGRSVAAFSRHFWTIAVPDRGVNNAFDYPIGLPYLLCLGPFLYLLCRQVMNKSISLFSFLVLVFWATWWMGSQQSRWLYIPLIFMFIETCSETVSTDSRLFRGGLILALLLTAASTFRSNRPDLRQWPRVALRAPDKQMLDASRRWTGRKPMDVNTTEVAFAESPVTPRAGTDVWLLPVKN